MDVKNILLTTDFSEEVQTAYPAAVSFAQRFNARIHLVHVTESATAFYLQSEGFGSATTLGDFHAELEREMTAEAEREVFEGADVASHLIRDSHLIDGL